MRHTWLHRFAALAALAVVAAACGSDRGDDPTAAEDTGDEAGSSDTTATDGEGSGDAVMFGDLESPCGEAEDDSDAAAAGAAEQGVTDSEIVIGYGDDAGFATSPGLSHEASDAIEAMIDWCNDQGGINGRQLVGNYYDAAITDVVNATTQACGEVFMLVGDAWALDSGQEETRLGCGLPAVPTYSVSPEFANAPLMYQAVPNPADIYPGAWAAQLAELFPDEITRATVMYGNFAATIDTKDKVLQVFDDYGFQWLDCPIEYNIAGEPDWKPFAQRLSDCGAEVVYYSGQPYPLMQNLLDDAAQVGYDPIWLAESNAYLQSFADWNATGNGDRVYLRTSFTPFEQADSNPATQQYLDIVTEHGGDTSQLGEQATSSFLLWATAAKECGADLTRQCVLDELSQVTSWTGGGLHAETNPGENLPPECSMILKLEGTAFVQVHPEGEGEFYCDPDSRVELTGRVVDQAELDENRISTKFQPQQ
ncbi:MAG TPA: ABC transporter substrate-binding protein [Acidimicrobiales bacterium]|nr:ABC transporter substrate-binding protein [Acidimicrobiales bacterium]